MAYDKAQFKDLIERTLKEIGLYSEGAVLLLLGTAAQESKFGSYLRQMGNGPARGAFQMERATFNDLVNRFHKRFPAISYFSFEQMEWDLRAAIIMARIKYFSIPAPLPGADDLKGRAAYWKQYYNTPLGSGTETEFIKSSKKFLGTAC